MADYLDSPKKNNERDITCEHFHFNVERHDLELNALKALGKIPEDATFHSYDLILIKHEKLNFIQIGKSHDYVKKLLSYSPLKDVHTLGLATGMGALGSAWATSNDPKSLIQAALLTSTAAAGYYLFKEVKRIKDSLEMDTFYNPHKYDVMKHIGNKPESYPENTPEP